jgi:DNA-binding transcriptional LysR family regulator
MSDLDDIERFPFYREPYVLVVPRGLREELEGQELAAIFEKHRRVRHSERSYVGGQVERHLSRSGLRPPRAFEFDTSDSLVAMVATGMGVAITTPLCLLQGIAHASHVSVLPRLSGLIGTPDRRAGSGRDHPARAAPHSRARAVVLASLFPRSAFDGSISPRL